MIDFKPITIDDAIDELERELNLRSKVYKKWIRSRKISRSQAARRYRSLAKAIDILKEQKFKS